MKMTRAYLLIIIMLLVGIPISAQIRGNHVNVWVVPDHQDWNYEVGQTAQFKVGKDDKAWLLSADGDCPCGW